MIRMNDLRFSALGGALCSVWASFSFGELLQTMLMAMVGTLVSFAITKLLQQKDDKE